MIATTVGLALLVAVTHPGDSARAVFLCHTAEAAMQYGLTIDTEPDRLSEVVLALIRGGECVALPPIARPTVTFEEMVFHQEDTDVWRVRWGTEVWFLAADTPGDGS